MAMSEHEKLTNFIPSYRTGYISSGGPDPDKLKDEDIVERMKANNVWNESLAEQQGRKDGFEDRQEKIAENDRQKPN